MPQEVLAENRFLAARDGMGADLIEPELGRRVPARELLADVAGVLGQHADALGCRAELEEGQPPSASAPGPRRQLDLSAPPRGSAPPAWVFGSRRRFPRPRLESLSYPNRAGESTNWVTMRLAASLVSSPSGMRSILTSITTVLRPTCSGAASATISSPRQAGAEDVQLQLDRREVVVRREVAEGRPGGDGVAERGPDTAVDEAPGVQMALVDDDLARSRSARSRPVRCRGRRGRCPWRTRGSAPGLPARGRPRAV